MEGLRWGGVLEEPKWVRRDWDKEQISYVFR